MTLGEKLKEARMKAGLSQEELSKKMCVSRSAIAKWETDKGMPDVNNLKMISSLLDVSIDYLLDDGKQLDLNTLKEPINIKEYTKMGKRKQVKDAVVLTKYKDVDAIYVVVRDKKLNKKEFWLDFLTVPGIVNVLDKLNNDSFFYLVEKGNRQYLVEVSDEYLTQIELARKIEDNKFVIGDYRYIKVLNLL